MTQHFSQLTITPTGKANSLKLNIVTGVKDGKRGASGGMADDDKNDEDDEDDGGDRWMMWIIRMIMMMVVIVMKTFEVLDSLAPILYAQATKQAVKQQEKNSAQATIFLPPRSI